MSTSERQTKVASPRELTPDYTRMGRWSAGACAAGAIAYGLAIILVGVLAPSTLIYTSYEDFARSYQVLPTLAIFGPPFIVSLVFPVLTVALWRTAPAERRPFATVSLVFAGIYTAVLGSDYWLQLTVIPWNIARGAGPEVAPWVAWNGAGFFWAFESFGYFVMGLSAMFAALAYRRHVMPRGARPGLIAMAPLGLAFMVNMALAWPEEIAGLGTLSNVSAIMLAIAWAVLFGFVAFSLTKWFGQLHGSTPGAE